LQPILGRAANLMLGLLLVPACQPFALAPSRGTMPPSPREPPSQGEPPAYDEPAPAETADRPQADASPVTGPRGTRAYDRHGSYAGRVDAHGNVYDRTGASAGRIDDDRFYDRTGAASGRIDGNYVYDGTGASAGRVDERGNIYDRTGAHAGRIDEHGNIYDRTGASAGRIDSSCDEQCRRTTGAQILLSN
jgi:hypothetical protein